MTICKHCRKKITTVKRGLATGWWVVDGWSTTCGNNYHEPLIESEVIQGILDWYDAKARQKQNPFINKHSESWRKG